MFPNTRFKFAAPGATPNWAERSDRALPAIATPSLRSAAVEVMDGLRPLAVLFVGRTLGAVALFVAAAAAGWWWLAVPATWLVYGSALTCVHHLIHGSLGLSPRTRHLWLSVIGAIVVESGHALQVTHLAHHRADAAVPDPEGYIENLTWRQMPLGAMRFRYRLMWWGLRFAPPARRRRIRIEAAVHAAAHLASLALLPITIVPWMYLSLIHLASFAFAVLAGKGPQTNWGRPIESPFVRVHTALGRIMFFSHDLHLEHHAYPKVPLPRLRRLRPQLDETFDSTDVVDVWMVV